jgi:hypothetical protein
MTAPINPTDFAAPAAAELFSVGAMVDAYGKLKAEAAKIEADMEAIKQALLATGRDAFREGALFDATVSISDGRETVKMAELRAKFGDEVEPLIKRGADVYTLRCTAKKAGK